MRVEIEMWEIDTYEYIKNCKEEFGRVEERLLILEEFRVNHVYCDKYFCYYY